jgi:hypothetical protein
MQGECRLIYLAKSCLVTICFKSSSIPVRVERFRARGEESCASGSLGKSTNKFNRHLTAISYLLSR